MNREVHVRFRESLQVQLLRATRPTLSTMPKAERDLLLQRFKETEGLRDYDPISGRWTAKDPILFQSGQGNLYIYSGNNPVYFTDPSGLKAAPCQDDNWSFFKRFRDNYRLHFQLVFDSKPRIIKAIDPSISETTLRRAGYPGKVISTYFVATDINETWQNNRLTTRQKIGQTAVTVIGELVVAGGGVGGATLGTLATGGPWGGAGGLILADTAVSYGKDWAYEYFDLE